jgi:hypothetical protein
LATGALLLVVVTSGPTEFCGLTCGPRATELKESNSATTNNRVTAAF